MLAPSKFTVHRATPKWFGNPHEVSFSIGSLWTRGGGGWPPTPPPQFFEQGITPPPMCRIKWGVPPAPPVPAGHFPLFPENPAGTPFHVGDSTRNTGFGHAKNKPFCGQEGEGGDPLPPHHLFFWRGSPPSPCAGSSGGTPSPFRPGPIPATLRKTGPFLESRDFIRNLIRVHGQIFFTHRQDYRSSL